MSGMSGDLEQAADTYWRAALRLWFLPITVYNAVRSVNTLQSTEFSAARAPDAGSRHRLVLTKPLAPGIPYANQNEALPESATKFEPPVLEPGIQAFHVLIRAEALHLLPGATYWGEVAVVDDVSGQEVGPRVDIWLVVS
jgi:hypothetical protein